MLTTLPWLCLVMKEVSGWSFTCCEEDVVLTLPHHGHCPLTHAVVR